MLSDSSGARVSLGRQLGRGGEGAVFEVAGAHDFVAKLYHRDVSPSKAQKLSAMAGLATPALLEIAAWPTQLLYRPDGRLAGILLPRVTGYKDIHILYSPAHRKADFPHVDWSFLVHTARNVAQSFSTIHHHGHVIGDVNQGNVLVSAKATAKFIDCDSFQIAQNGSSFLCEVGVAHFTPPELQAKSFAGVRRTPNHDNFGLAVLIFHLLFMGRHPFAGRYHGAGDMPIERAIAEIRFAFSAAAGMRQMSPPPYALTLTAVSTGLAALFERAFSPETARSTARPTAAEWVAALDTLRGELRTCSAYSGHKYHRALADCPWCGIDRAGGPDFFISITGTARLAAGFDLPAAWAAILAVGPPPAVALPHPAQATTTTPRPVPTHALRLRWLKRVTAGLTAALTAGTILVPFPLTMLVLAGVLALTWLILHMSSPYTRERRARRSALRAAEAADSAAAAKLEEELTAAQVRFQAKLKELEQQRNAHQALQAQQLRDRHALESKREELQRHEYLDHFFIDQAQLKGVGPSLKQTLVSYGIETAADVTAAKVEAVPGFGPKKTATLLAWRASKERGFRFDPSKGVAPAELAALDQRYAAKRQVVERALRKGPEELRPIADTARDRRTELLRDLARVRQELEQRRADSAVM